MKRSEINQLQREAVAFFREHKFYLPPWAYWSPAEWQQHRHQIGDIVKYRLGWDLTDFGSGDFQKIGLLLFTLRNGKVGEPGGKDYAEKVMIVREAQVTPWHFHWHKMEDIINRGGGNLVIEVCHSTADGQLDDRPVTVYTDGLRRTVEARGKIRLHAGESITLTPGLYHQFYGEPGKGQVLVGEVSRVNDDEKDNRFLQPLGRFPKIEEDEPPLYYLCNEYPFS